MLLIVMQKEFLNVQIFQREKNFFSVKKVYFEFFLITIPCLMVGGSGVSNCTFCEKKP